MYSVILCGGSGTRLWPLSRNNYPKQFLKLYSDKSLLQETYVRLKKITPKKNIIFVTNKSNFFNVFNQIKEIEKNFSRENILIEPKSLNTAPAITLAMKYISTKKRKSSDCPVIISPADHYVKDVQNYARTLRRAAKNVKNNIGTIGITPTSPETGYGYIRKGKKQKGFSQVLEFKEKPDRITAEKYLASGEYVWNSGMYIFSEAAFCGEIAKHAPKIHKLFKKDYASLLSSFEKMPSISIDCAVSEKSDRVVVFEGDFGWSDIGSFDSLSAVKIKDKNPKHLNFDSKNVYVHTDSNRLVATLGVSDINIIETADCILVQKQGRAEEVKKITDYIKSHNLRELEHNLIVHRPWGKYEVLIDEPYTKVKRITVYPQAKLSLQAHRRRAEHWVVVKGTAKVVNGEKIITLKENESTYIPVMVKHRLANEGKEDLKIIEVQTGDYLEEDDIIRYEDSYDRT